MLNSEMFKFWIIPKNVTDISKFIDSQLEVPKRGRPKNEQSNTQKESILRAERVQQNKQKAKERDEEFISLYKSGKTLQEIGEIYGISRERVRQRLSKNGLIKSDGGSHIKTFINLAENAFKNRGFTAKREIACINYYGCSREYRDSLGDCNVYGQLPMAYKSQKNSARKRGIEFNLTLPEWIEIWQNSGQLHNRGLGAGKYVMARVCDSGAYEKDNVEIITHSQNSKDCRAMDKVLGRKVGGTRKGKKNLTTA